MYMVLTSFNKKKSNIGHNFFDVIPFLNFSKHISIRTNQNTCNTSQLTIVLTY